MPLDDYSDPGVRDHEFRDDDDSVDTWTDIYLVVITETWGRGNLTTTAPRYFSPAVIKSSSAEFDIYFPAALTRYPSDDNVSIEAHIGRAQPQEMIYPEGCARAGTY